MDLDACSAHDTTSGMTKKAAGGIHQVARQAWHARSAAIAPHRRLNCGGLLLEGLDELAQCVSRALQVETRSASLSPS